MTKAAIVLTGVLIFASAGISAFVSVKLFPRCNVEFSYHENEEMDKKDFCSCIVPEVDRKIEKFKINIDKVSFNKKWVRFTLSSNGLDDIYGFMKKEEDNRWKVVDYGTYIEDEDMDKYSVPQDVRPDFIQSH